MKDLDGLKAIVTGGGSGIGLATAQHLAERGAGVAVLDLDPSGAAPMPGFVADVRDQASVTAAIEGAVAELGGLDILVNNAGIGAAGTVVDNDDEEWHRVFDINVVGIARTARVAVEHLLASDHAVIINTCSIAATAGIPVRAVYSATKGAVLSLTRAMAADYINRIRVNCVHPGTADTPWVNRLLAAAADPEAERAALSARQPMGRLVTADEVAFAIANLASPLSSATTGVGVAVDGGMQELRVSPKRS